MKRVRYSTVAKRLKSLNQINPARRFVLRGNGYAYDIIVQKLFGGAYTDYMVLAVSNLTNGEQTFSADDLARCINFKF